MHKKKRVIVFKGVGGWGSSRTLSLRAKECYDNMTINMDESPKKTPSQAPVLLKSVPILKSDNAVMVKQSRTALLFSFTHSSSPWQTVSSSPPAPPTTHMQRYGNEDKDMKVCTDAHKMKQNTHVLDSGGEIIEPII